MLIILVLLFFIMLFIGSILGICAEEYSDKATVGAILTIIGGLGFGVLLLIFVSCLWEVVGEKAIDKKIEMYQEENKNIEEQVTTVVNSYKDYEKEVISNATEMTTILLKLPEIKSNELVSKQIQIYVDNNNKIKELKEEKANVITYKWWVYFGE